MPAIALVRLRHAPKEYWFDPNQTGAKEGDHVLVETARGKEMGLCVDGAFEVDEKEISKPLKPVLRVATEEDLAQAEEMAKKGRGALPTFRSLVEKNGLDMKPVEVDFVFDGTRATFYFTAEERVDFRSLVRELASEFHVRIDMRQIGVRDEARMLGGLGHCGEELCCRRLGGDFQPVSIRMAKEQDLPLNPAKISGLCGRLMCCLRYEYEAYKDFKGRAPKKNALIETPQGLAKVVEFDTPRENVHVRFEDGSTMALPVASLDTGDKVPKNGERIRPCHISQEKFDALIEELHHDETLAMMGEKRFSDNPELADQEAEAGAVERNPRRRRRSDSKASGDKGSFRHRGGRGGADREPAHRDQRKRRRSVSATVEGEDARHRGGDEPRGHGREGSGASSEQGAAKEQGRNRNRRRRRRRGGGGSAQNADRAQNAQKEQHNSGHHDKSRPHPGQHSSAVGGDAARPDEGGSAQGRGNGNRKRRRRRRGSGGGNRNSQGTQGGSQGKQGDKGPSANREGE